MSESENHVDPSDQTPPPDASTDAPPTTDESTRKGGSGLRRRVVWGLIVVLVGATIGATLGWSSQEPIYESRGILYIQPSMPTHEELGGLSVLPLFHAFMAAQVELLSTSRMAEAAMRTDVWRETGELATPAGIKAFQAGCLVVHERETNHIQILCRDPDPAKAQAGVQALIEAYTKLARELSDGDERLRYAQQQVEVLNQKIKSATTDVLELTTEYGGSEGLKVLHRGVIEQLLATEAELRKVQEEIRRQEAAAGSTPIEIGTESPQMAQLLLQLEQLRAEAALLAKKVTEQHEQLKLQRKRIERKERQIADFAKAWNEARAEESVKELKSREKELLARLAKLRESARKQGQTLVEVARLQAERDALTRDLDQMKTLRDQLEQRLQGTGHIKVYSQGSLPTEPYKDDRVLYAWIGGLIGGLAALALVLLFGFVSRRLGRTADANAYHARVREAVSLLPNRIGEWKGHDVALPPAAARLPRPNLVVGREFTNPSTGEHATLRIVQCKDARDLSAHYPPIQYPANGWTMREAQPRHLPALLTAIPGTVYRFTRESADGSAEVLVYNFFARPDGSLESGPAGALDATTDTHTQALGAAQFQILLGPAMNKDRRDEVFRTLIAAALPVMDALCVEDEEA